MVKKLVYLFIASAIPINVCLAQVLGWTNLYPGLSNEDIQILENTARIDMNDKPVGTVLKWNNPNTRAKGAVKLIERSYEKGQECRKIQHSFRVVGSSPWSFISTICRQEDGSWKILEAAER
jgi:surface antigen